MKHEYDRELEEGEEEMRKEDAAAPAPAVTADTLRELERLEREATPAPWDTDAEFDVLFGPNDDGTGISFDHPPDARLIALLRNNARALIAACRADPATTPAALVAAAHDVIDAADTTGEMGAPFTVPAPLINALAAAVSAADPGRGAGGVGDAPSTTTEQEPPLKEALRLIHEKIESYGGGDRPSSPPAWMLAIEELLHEAASRHAESGAKA